MKGMREKEILSRGGYQCQEGGHKKKGMRGNMVDVFFIHL
jgi:ribosomal protein S6E (S10)